MPTTTGCLTSATRAPNHATARLQRRLGRLQADLRRAREHERVLEEQVTHLGDVADDADTQRLVAGHPEADRDFRDATTDLDRHAAALNEVRRQVAALLDDRDRLLDRLVGRETVHTQRDHE